MYNTYIIHRFIDIETQSANAFPRILRAFVSPNSPQTQRDPI